MANELDAWPGGATWVFQGTVAEDATAGTHVCTLTVTPGAGNELQFIGGIITVGATATAQTAQTFVTDGTNNVYWILNPQGGSSTVTSQTYALPQTGQQTFALLNTDADFGGPVSFVPVSGTMRLILSVTTTQISVTQTFALVARIKGAVPTAALADTVGTPVLTTNTSKVF